MATREFNFTVGPETSDQPSASTPSADDDLMTKGYADIHYAQGRLSCADVTAIKAVGASSRTNGDLVLNRATNKLYRFDSSSSLTGDDYNVLTPSAGTGRWILFGSSTTSTGEINCITSPSDAANWVASGAGVTVATSTTAADLPLEGIIASCLKITGVSGSDYARLRFTMPDALLSRKLKLEWFQLTAGSYAAGDFKIDVYYNAASNYGGAYTRVALSTDSSAVSSIPNFNGRYSTTFDDVATNLYYEIRFTRTAGTSILNLANIVLGPGVQPQGAVVDEWVSYVPTTQGLGTLASTNVYYRRVGSALEVKGDLTTGTKTAAELQIGLPTGLTIGSSIGPVAPTTVPVGKMYVDASSTVQGIIVATAGDSFVNIGYFNDGSARNLLTTVNADDAWGAGAQRLAFEFSVPISQWAGSGTVNLAQNDVEYASNSGSTDADDTTNFAYGPAGSTGVIATTALTATRAKRVQFKTPIQPGDTLIFEYQPGGGTNPWLALYGGPDTSADLGGWDVQNSVSYGVQIRRVSGSTTTLDVVFGTYAWNSAATFGGVGGSWASALAATRWRVKKFSSGQAVGFGKNTDGSLGLVNTYTGSISTTFTADGSGGSSGAKTVYVQRLGDWVTVHVPSTTLTSGTSSTKMTSNTALPSWARPLTATQGCGALAQMLDNNAQIAVPALVWVDTSGIITYQKTATGSTFTNSATMGTNIAHTHTYYVGTGS